MCTGVWVDKRCGETKEIKINCEVREVVANIACYWPCYWASQLMLVIPRLCMCVVRMFVCGCACAVHRTEHTPAREASDVSRDQAGASLRPAVHIHLLSGHSQFGLQTARRSVDACSISCSRRLTSICITVYIHPETAARTHTDIHTQEQLLTNTHMQLKYTQVQQLT